MLPMKVQELVPSLDELLAGRRWDDAIAMANAAIARNPRDPGLYTSLAAALMGAGRPADALAAADNARLLAPTWEWSHRMRARALAELGRADEALAAAEKADQLEEDKPGMLDALISEQMTHKRLAEAEATANELVRIDPDWAEAWNARGAVLLQRKKFEQAESDFRTALSISPNEAAYMRNIGLALHRRGRRKEAAEWFGKSAAIDPGLAVTRTRRSRSSRLGLWLGGFVILASIAHVIEIGLRGRSNTEVFAYIGAGLLLATVPVILLRYWIRRRSPAPTTQDMYKAESRLVLGRFTRSSIVRNGGVIILLSAFVFSFLYLKDIRLTYVFIIAAIVWARGWEIWRFAGRLFQR
jgi:Flp pilus assembly protein TadD